MLQCLLLFRLSVSTDSRALSLSISVYTEYCKWDIGFMTGKAASGASSGNVASRLHVEAIVRMRCRVVCGDEVDTDRMNVALSVEELGSSPRQERNSGRSSQDDSTSAR